MAAGYFSTQSRSAVHVIGVHNTCEFHKAGSNVLKDWLLETGMLHLDIKTSNMV